MTHLRQIMLEELERRNYAPGTIRCYIHVVEQFARHFHRPPDQLGLEHIRQYQAGLLRQKKLAPSTVGQHLAALRFFYIQVLKQGWSAAETPYPRPVQHLPQVLSREEVARLIQAARTPFQRAVLMALYAPGGRRAEVATLKFSDIDSQRMLPRRAASFKSLYPKRPPMRLSRHDLLVVSAPDTALRLLAQVSVFGWWAQSETSCQ